MVVMLPSPGLDDERGLPVSDVLRDLAARAALVERIRPSDRETCRRSIFRQSGADDRRRLQRGERPRSLATNSAVVMVTS
jgi:hypothetical protein